MLTSSGHLTYCSNIHPGENWQDHFGAIGRNFPGIKQQLSPNKPMGLGLRLANNASKDLLENGKLELFKQWLADNDAYVFTMNGFPYGEFHQNKVKDQVHAPDWTTNDRLDYTTRLFDILVQLLPEGMDGGISTSPLSYRYWFQDESSLQAATETATANILKVAEHLVDLADTTGKIMHLDIEPEPDGILDNGTDFLNWYDNYLLPMGVPLFVSKYGLNEAQAAKLIKAHICLCYDVCHYAVGYEPHQEMVNKIAERGIKVGKIQISAALKAKMEQGEDARLATAAAFGKFNEPVYLHQVVAKTTDDKLLRYRDLPEAINDQNNPAVTEWRAHFHVPVFEKNFGLLSSTQEDILAVLAIQAGQAFTNHLEVETYTWEVLDEQLKAPVQESITRELRWVMDVL